MCIHCFYWLPAAGLNNLVLEHQVSAAQELIVGKDNLHPLSVACKRAARSTHGPPHTPLSHAMLEGCTRGQYRASETCCHTCVGCICPHPPSCGAAPRKTSRRRSACWQAACCLRNAFALACVSNMTFWQDGCSKRRKVRLHT